MSTPHCSTLHFHIDIQTSIENHYTNFKIHSGFVTESMHFHGCFVSSSLKLWVKSRLFMPFCMNLKNGQLVTPLKQVGITCAIQNWNEHWLVMLNSIDVYSTLQIHFPRIAQVNFILVSQAFISRRFLTNTSKTFTELFLRYELLIPKTSNKPISMTGRILFARTVVNFPHCVDLKIQLTRAFCSYLSKGEGSNI